MSAFVVLVMYSGLLTIWLIILTALIAKEKQFLHDLGVGVTKKDLTSILKQLHHSLKVASAKLEVTSDKTLALETAGKRHFQKMGFVRFNPFADTGGDQSFSFCLLDHDNNGIVITSLHTRNTTRLYAKEVAPTGINKSDYSQEEWNAYQAAKNYH